MGWGPHLQGEAVSARDLAVGYDDGPDVLTGASFVVMAGELVVLVGGNGAGKTTLLRSLAGLVGPRAGDARIAGHAPDSIEARRTLAYASDTPVFYEGVSVGENIEFVGRLHGISGAADAPVVSELGLDGLLDRLPARLSRGQRQRAHLVMSLVRPWEVAVLDEPTVALDADSRRRLVGHLRRQCDAGKVAVVATHDPEVIAAATVVAQLAEGLLSFPGGTPMADPVGQ